MLVFSGILARILTPADFGMIAMVTMATGFLNVLKDFGFGAALIQKENVSQDEYSTVFWFNIALGSILTAAVWFSAPFIALFFDEPALEQVCRALSFTFLITSGGIVLENFLVKEMQFKQLFYRSFLAAAMSGLVSVGFALNGAGYWALVIQSYVNISLLVMFTYLKVRWRPSLTYRYRYIKELQSFSLPLLGDQAINYWSRNIDNLLVGKFFGKFDLALYNRSYSLMLLPVRQISGSLTRVLFPSLSTIKDDIDKVRNVYLKTSGIIALITFPIMTFLFIMSSEVLLLVYGKQWLGAVPLFRILCFLGALQSIGTLLGNVFMSQGRTDLLFRIGLVSKFLMISGILVGIYFGRVETVALGYVCGGVLAFLPETFFLSRILKTRLTVVLFNITNQFFCSLVMGLILFFLVPYMAMGIVPKMLLSGLIAAISYGSLIFATRDRAFRNILKLIHD